jgi:hypothetical protein
MSAACITVTRAARRQPQQLRSASLPYVRQSVRENKANSGQDEQVSNGAISKVNVLEARQY